MGESSHMDECASPQQGDEKKTEGKEWKSSYQSNREIEMTSMEVRTIIVVEKRVLFVAFETIVSELFGSPYLSFYPKIAT